MRNRGVRFRHGLTAAVAADSEVVPDDIPPKPAIQPNGTAHLDGFVLALRDLIPEVVLVCAGSLRRSQH
jgi:hypothetical protein